MKRINNEMNKLDKAIMKSLKESIEVNTVKESEQMDNQSFDETILSLFVEFCDQSRESYTSLSDVRADFLSRVESVISDENSAGSDNLDEFLSSVGL